MPSVFGTMDWEAGIRPQPTTDAWFLISDVAVPFAQMAERLLEKISAKEQEQILQHWHALHQLILHSEQAPMEDDHAKKEKVKLCYYAGFCVCFLDDLRSFVGALQKAIKTFCPAKSHNRQMLWQGMFCWQLTSHVSSFWFFIAYINLNTSRGALMALEQDDDDTALALADISGGVALVPRRPMFYI